MSAWTPERHAAARKRCEEATAGPWTVREDLDGYPLVKMPATAQPYGARSRASHRQDADFIADARTDLPDALDRIERLESAIRRALNDSETGDGWGPDVTVAGYLREALSEDTVAAPSHVAFADFVNAAGPVFTSPVELLSGAYDRAMLWRKLVRAHALKNLLLWNLGKKQLAFPVLMP